MTPTSTSAGTHVVTATEAGVAVTLHVGETLVVKAPAGGLPVATFQLQPGAAGVLKALDGGPDPRAASFAAVGPGDATVVVAGGPSCSKGAMCPAIRQLLGRVQVHVIQ